MKSRNPEQPIVCGFRDVDGKVIKKRETPKVANVSPPTSHINVAFPNPGSSVDV